MFKKLFTVTGALAIMAGILAPSAALAQNEMQYMELLRSDIKTQKVAILTEALQLTEEQSAAFWPLYREYDLELSKLGDRRIAQLRSYADNFAALTDEKAKQMADDYFKLEEDRLKLKKNYFKKMEKELGANTAARFTQIENQIELLIDVQLASEMPLIKAAPATVSQ